MIPRFIPEASTTQILQSIFHLPKKDEIKNLRQLIKQYFRPGTEDVIFTESASAGIYWLLRFFKPPRIYMPAYLCASVYEAAVRAGVPITYLDLQPHSFDTNIEKINYQPGSMLLLVHLYGIPSNPNKALEIADKNNLILVEDNASAIGSTWQGQLTGTFAEISLLSFEYSKTIYACKGGAILFKNKELAKKVNDLIINEQHHNRFFSHLKWMADAFIGIGYNIALQPEIYRNISLPIFRKKFGAYANRSAGIDPYGKYQHTFGQQRAWLAASQISQLEEIINHRRQITHIYQESLAKLDAIEIPDLGKDAQPIYTHYPILVEYGKKATIVKELWNRGLDPGFNYSYLCGGKQPEQEVPVSEDYTQRILTLPVSSRLPIDKARLIVEVFRDVIKEVN